MKIRIILCACLLCLLLVGFGVQSQFLAAAGNTYYVSTTGSDSNNGSLAAPWATLQHAANAATAGVTVNIEAGTYYQKFNITNSGSAGNPITFQNYNGGTVIIDGTGSGIGEYGIANIQSTASYITISGITFRNSPDFGILVDPSGATMTNIIIQNNTVYNCGLSGIAGVTNYDSGFSSPTISYLTVTGNTVYNCNTSGAWESISISGVSHFTVSNNIEYGDAYAAGAGIDCKNGDTYGNVNNNSIYSNRSLGIYLDARGAENNINIFDNLIYNNSGSGIELADEAGRYVLNSIEIYNNILYNNYRAFQVDHYGSETINFSFINNTLYNNSASSGSEILIAASQTNLNNCIIENNIIYSLTSGAYGILNYSNGGVSVDHNLFYNSGGSWNPGNTFGTNYLTGNPLLTSPTTNFTLQSGSPAIAAGNSAGSPSTDYAGITRSSPPCIGAYEYTSSSGSSDPPTTVDINAIMVTSPSSLPSASASYRGVIAIVQGGSGVSDALYQCMKSASNNYSWVLIASGG